MAFKGTPKRQFAERSPLWAPETLKDDLRRGAATLTSICKRYAEDEKKWRALYNDVQRWKRDDPELVELLELNRKKTDPKKRKSVGGGRPRKDTGENADFRVKFCERLLQSKSRNDAASVTPYSPEEIYQMLNPNYTSYDEKFAEMVHLTEMRLVAWAEEEMWMSLEDAQHPKDRAWIAKEILKVRDRHRWGDKLDVNVSATHTHVLGNETKLLMSLESERRSWFEKHDDPTLLESGEVIEAEIVQVEKVEAK